MKKVLFIFTTYFLLLTPAYAQSVDLLWQGETYTPPFYQGRALWSTQSWVTVVAIPQGLGNPGNLIYKWSKNDTVLGDINGRGQNTLTFKDSIFSKPQVVKIEILSPAEEVLAEAKTTLTPKPPLLLAYEKNPLLGYMFHQEVGEEFYLEKEEITFSAFPLFASPASRNGENLTYRWGTNSGDTQSGDSVTYRIPEGTRGSSKIDLVVSNKDKLMKDLTKEFLVQFGEQ